MNNCYRLNVTQYIKLTFMFNTVHGHNEQITTNTVSTESAYHFQSVMKM